MPQHFRRDPDSRPPLTSQVANTDTTGIVDPFLTASTPERLTPDAKPIPTRQRRYRADAKQLTPDAKPIPKQGKGDTELTPRKIDRPGAHRH